MNIDAIMTGNVLEELTKIRSHYRRGIYTHEEMESAVRVVINRQQKNLAAKVEKKEVVA